MITTVAHLRHGVPAVVLQIKGGVGIRRRLNHLGVHPGDRIEVIRNGYLGGPVLIQVHGAKVGIGGGMAERIEVEAEEP